MAHELEIVNGEANMAYAGNVPWHGLGKKVPSDVSPEQMLKAANLDWAVEKRQMFFKTENGDKITDQYALVRSTDNKHLTTVSSQWNPVQNIEAFEFFNDFVLTGDMEMHTAGSLKGGRMVWAMAQIKESFELFGGDRVEGYLLFSNPHEFGRSIDIRFTPVRVVCNNTLTMALSGDSTKNAVKINHRQRFDADEIKSVLGIAGERLQKYKQQAEFLGQKKFSKETITEYFNRVFPSMSKDEMKLSKTSFPISRQANEAMEVLHTQPGANFAEGSWWSGFNAVTYMTDHTLGRSRDSRLTSAWYGLNRAKKEKALELAIEYAEMA
jgi:phage/plasmid-like protein (TIGR03299 family)